MEPATGVFRNPYGAYGLANNKQRNTPALMGRADYFARVEVLVSLLKLKGDRRAC